VVARKVGYMFFFFNLKPYFQLVLTKTSRKEIKHLLKPINGLKDKKKITSKPIINLKQKILPGLNLVSYAISRLKKHLYRIHNSSHQMKPFYTKINYFGGRNQ
jgi:hypothetical protein